MNTQLKHAEHEQCTQYELSNKLFDSDFFTKVSLKGSARLVLMVLCRYYPNIYPSMETLKKKSGIGSKDTINNALIELRDKGLIISETKHTNHYKFTAKFFTLLKIAPPQSKNKTTTSPIFGPNKTNKQTIKKRVDLKKFEKPHRSKYHHNTHITGIDYKKFEKPDFGDKVSPLALNKEQSKEFLDNLPKNLQNSFFARELRKKWRL